MSGRRPAPYEGLGKNKLEYTKVIPKFLQGISAPPPAPPPEEDNPELEAQEEKELIERMMKEQKEDEEKRKEFYAEKGIKDPNPKQEIVQEPEPELEPEDDTPSVDENGKILFKRPKKHKLDEIQKTKENKSKKSKVDIKKQLTTKPSKKETAASKNTTLLSFEDDE
eukprot:Phypoly_transcript_22943.p1 GENE.Phypoly_transcript_22943~~Phypoly_transcript_22943.p1  ORF type:complete len:167 (+),score=64.17 Phypoly_transcript_22943:59-559(+)